MIDHFVDATPADDDEFALLADDVLHARSKDASEDHVDLLTVVLHELGHLAGLAHTATADGNMQLMDEKLSLGFESSRNSIDGLLPPLAPDDWWLCRADRIT